MVSRLSWQVTAARAVSLHASKLGAMSKCVFASTEATVSLGSQGSFNYALMKAACL